MPKDSEGFDGLPSNSPGDYESEATVSKIQERLKEYGGATDDVGLDTPPIPEPKGKPTDKSDSTPELEPKGEPEPADDDESTLEPNGKSAAGDDESGEQKPVIPDNHYRALIHAGWTPEKISGVYDKDSELLLELAEKAYEDVNNLSQQFAKLGRSKLEMDRKEREAQTAQPQVQPQQPARQGPDLVKLKEQYEEDPFGATVELLKAFNRPQEPTTLPQTQSQQPTVTKEQFQDDLALTQQLIHFFGGKDMKPYSEFYGPVYGEDGQPYITTDHLTAGQHANRQQVLVMTDRILAGAAFQGEEMPLQKALAMAHMMVSGPVTKQVIRNELVSQVKKKANGVTLRPTSRKAVTPKSKPGEGKSEKDLERATEARLDAYKEGKPLK